MVVPIEVVEEIDRFKRDPSEKGRNARQVSRLLDDFRQKGNLADGVTIDKASGGTPQEGLCPKGTPAHAPPGVWGGQGVFWVCQSGLAGSVATAGGFGLR